MSTETNTVLAAAAPMDVSDNATVDAAAPKKRGRKPKTEGAVGTAAAPKTGVKKGSTGKKKEVEETSEEKPKAKKAKKEKSDKEDAKKDTVKEDAKKDEVAEKKPKAKKSKKDDAKDDVKDGDDAKPKKRSRKTGSKTNADGSPKKPRALCSYMLFVKSVRAKVAAENPSLKTTEIGKKMGEMWRALSEDEKKAFKSADTAVAEAVVCANPSQWIVWVGFYFLGY